MTVRIGNIFLDRGERIVRQVMEPVIVLFVFNQEGRYVKAELGPLEVAELYRQLHSFLQETEALIKEQINETAEDLKGTIPGWYRNQYEYSLKRLEDRLKKVQEALEVKSV